jgi:large subunit ribosomal protein L24
VKSKVHVKKGDTVLVLTGKDKGKKGKVLRVNTATERVVVEGANKVTKHQRPNRTNPHAASPRSKLRSPRPT